LSETLLAVLGGIGGAYGALQSWLTRRKMRQVEEEMLAPKLDIDFRYNIVLGQEFDLLHGIVSFENKGATNVKIIRLNIDVRDRSNEFSQSYLKHSPDSDDGFEPLKGGFELLNIVGLNNYKLVNFSNSSSGRSFRIFKRDNIYAREKEKKMRDIEDIDRNIQTFIEEKIDQLRDFLREKIGPEFREELRRLIFVETIGKELRGIQIFPNAVLHQEFIVKYKGSGILYCNVETSTIRVLQDTIDYIEDYKVLGDRIFKNQTLDENTNDQLVKVLENILSPESHEIHKQKETFLVYLS